MPVRAVVVARADTTVNVELARSLGGAAVVDDAAPTVGMSEHMHPPSLALVVS